MWFLVRLVFNIFEEIYNVFSVLDVKEHKLVLNSNFGSYVLACARSKL